MRNSFVPLNQNPIAMDEKHSGTLYYHVLLDASGSMSRNIKEVLEEINDKLKLLKEDSSTSSKRCVASIWSFTTSVNRLREHQFVQEIPLVQPEEYFASGMTALYDAVGLGLSAFHQNISGSFNKETDQAIFIVFTDGMENSSREYNYSKVQDVIAINKSRGYEVIFMGSDMQAYQESKDLSFGVSYYVDQQNTKEAFMKMKESIRASYLRGEKFNLDRDE